MERITEARISQPLFEPCFDGELHTRQGRTDFSRSPTTSRLREFTNNHEEGRQWHTAARSIEANAINPSTDSILTKLLHDISWPGASLISA